MGDLLDGSFLDTKNLNLDNEFNSWFSRRIATVISGTEFFNDTIQFLNQIDLNIIRSNWGTRTLHPQVETINQLWFEKVTPSILSNLPKASKYSRSIFEFQGGEVIETRWSIGNIMTDLFRNSSVAFALEKRTLYRFHLAKELRLYKDPSEYPFAVIRDLEELGATDYLVYPVHFTSGGFVYASFCSNKPEGFTELQVAFLGRITPIIANFWERFILKELTDTLLRLYLGKRTGPLVSAGKILRGDAERIRSVIWFSDIRSFTTISESIPEEKVIHLLNLYFGIVIPRIEKAGGEVLKLIGDAVLAIFPDNKSYATPRLRALVSARQIQSDLDKANQDNLESELPELAHGIGLHFGEVLYGNIGSHDRFDFTVVGSSVNLASRISNLCGQLGMPVLASQAFIENTSLPWKDMGSFALKGFTNEQILFGLESV